MKQVTFVLSGLVIGVLLFACACSATESPTLRFTSEKVDLNNMQWMEELAVEYGVELDPRGIYALDENRVFLFGGLEVPAGVVQSVLLLSDDGGKHWSEVMHPERGSVVSEIVFIEDGYGWALVVWTVEGLGPACLYRTANYGENWQKQSDIPYPGGHSDTAGLRFSDQHQGQVKVNQHGEGNWCILDSTDGGLTWNETGDCCHVEECDFEWPSQDMVLAQDGSRWQFEVDSFDVAKELREVRVSRQLSYEKTWTVVSRIPVHYEYMDGHPVIPQQE